MKTNPQKPSDQPLFKAPTAKSTWLPSRRSFLVSTAAVVGAQLLYSRHRQAVEAAENPTIVTLIAFSPDGKPIGRVTIPRVVKSEADWKKQLSPISFDVTRHAGTHASTPATPVTCTITASTAASAATTLSSARRRSSTPAPAGPASTTHRQRECGRKR